MTLANAPVPSRKNRLSTRGRQLLLALYALGILAGLFMHSKRWRQESANRGIEIVLDYNAIAEYAREDGKTLPQELEAYRAQGVRSLGFTELRQDDLENRGIAEVYSGFQLGLTLPAGATKRPEVSKTYLMIFQPSRVEPLLRRLQWSLGTGKVRLWRASSAVHDAKAGPDPTTAAVLEVDLPIRVLANLGFGFSDEDIKTATNLGLGVWLRPENKPQSGEAAVSAMFDEIAKIPNVHGLIFGGSSNEAVGYPEALNLTADKMKAKGYELGLIESDKKSQQKGIEGLVRLMPERTVRVFAVAPAHQQTLKPDQAGQMYSLAGRERNARVLYIRPYAFTNAPEKGFEDANPTFMKHIADDLRPQFANATRFETEVKPNPFVLTLMSLGSWAVAWLMLDLVVGLPPMLMIAFGLGLVGVTDVTYFAGSIGQLWRSLMALGTGVAASLFAMMHFYPDIEELSQSPAGGYTVLNRSMAIWFRMSMLSLVGALLASSYLQETTFKLGLDIFRGVKLLTVVVPVLAVVAWVTRERGLAPVRELLTLRLQVYHLVAFIVLGALAVIYILRTGNMSADMGGSALEYEKILRVGLDKYLHVRPRFKEFLLAHPAMILLPLVLWMRGRSFGWLFLLAGAIGQCGFDDTFAHIHTPLQISLERTLLGLVLGGIVGWLAGAVAIGLYRRFLLREIDQD